MEILTYLLIWEGKYEMTTKKCYPLLLPIFLFNFPLGNIPQLLPTRSYFSFIFFSKRSTHGSPEFSFLFHLILCNLFELFFRAQLNLYFLFNILILAQWVLIHWFALLHCFPLSLLFSLPFLLEQLAKPLAILVLFLNRK